MSDKKDKLITTNGFLYKIKSFFAKLFNRKTNNVVEEKEEIVSKEEKVNDFKKEIVIENDKEKDRIIALQVKFKNNEITEEEMDPQDVKKVSELYDEQIAELKERIRINRLMTEQYKKDIMAMKNVS